MSLGRIKALEDQYKCLCKQLNEIDTGEGGGGGTDPTALHPGDDISQLSNDVGYLVLADIVAQVITDALGYTPVSNLFASDAEVTAGNTVKAVNGSGVKNHVATAIAALLDSAPGTLDTLNELAAALGDDPNFATTVTNLIASKVTKDGTVTESIGGLKTFSALLTAAAGLATTNITTTGGDVGTSGSTFLNAFVKRINAIGTLTLISGATSDILWSNSSPTAGVFGILKGATGRFILQPPGAATTTDTTEQLQVNGDAKITTDLSVGDDLTVAGDLILSAIAALATKPGTVLVNDGGTIKTRTLEQFADDLIDNTSLRRTAYAEAQGNSTSLNSLGLGITAQGTATSRPVNFSSTNQTARQRRVGYVSTNGANSLAGVICAAQFALFYGFVLKIRFSVQVYDAGHRYTCGLGETSTATVNPSTLLNRIHMFVDPGMTTWRITTADDATVATPIDLGANFPADTSAADAYELILETAPNSGNVKWTVKRVGTAFSTTGNFTTNLPVNTTLLAPQVFANNAGIGNTAQLNLIRIHAITDY